MKNDLKIVFMGTPNFAVASLKALIDADYNIVGIITAPDKPAGRGRKRSEEHTSELQSRRKLVCRLLLEKKK